MADKRTFWEKLLRRKTRKVLKKDENGGIIGKTTYRFDRYGEVVERIDATFDSSRNAFITCKDKTYTRQSDGSYDPAVTTYFDNQGRETTRREYKRDFADTLTCKEENFAYTPAGKMTSSYLEAEYAGGWVKKYKEENLFDSFGEVIQSKIHEKNPLTGRLSCVKDKMMMRNADGSYDPKETTYYDWQGRVTRHKAYYHKQTALGNTLFGDDEKFSYPNDVQKTEKKETRFLMLPGINRWGSMEELKKLDPSFSIGEEAKMSPREAMEVIARQAREGQTVDGTDGLMVLTGKGPSLKEIAQAMDVLKPQGDKTQQALDPQFLKVLKNRDPRS